jgi:hypothetical protein
MKTLHLLGKNNHIGGVDLYIGTEDELTEIATAGDKNSIFEVAPEDQADPDSPWPEGPGWYYAIGDRDYVKVDTRFEAVAAILQHDGHPLSFTVEEAKEILRRSDAAEDTGLWHHNRSKVIAAIRRCLEERELLPPEPPKTITAKDWNNQDTKFSVGDNVLVHEDEGTLWEATIIDFTKDGSIHLQDAHSEGFELPCKCEILTESF